MHSCIFVMFVIVINRHTVVLVLVNTFTVG